MSPKDAWDLLGIDPTDDKRAVKRAYAAKLKSIDPDADPKAFLALRDAFQIAQWEAEYGPAEEYDWQDYEEGGAHWQADEEEALEPSGVITDDDVDQFDGDPSSRSPDFAPQIPTDGYEARNRIDGLIWQEDRDARGDLKLQVAVRDLLTDPRMEQVDFANDTEEWLARTMAYAIPQSDPIIPIVVDHFGWEARRMNVRETFGLAECAARADDLACMARLSEPTHKWHGAYQRLQLPSPAKISFMERRRNKEASLDLLRSLREYNPDVERNLNADHVALWDKIVVSDVNKISSTGTASNWGALRLGFFALLFLVQFLRFCSAETDTAPGPLPSYTPEALEIELWRNEQTPRVQDWMAGNSAEVVTMFREQQAKGGGPPSCAALDVAANLTPQEYDRCYDQQLAREARSRAVSGSLPPVQAAAKQGNYYYSPGWQNEQSPRVRQWMEDNRDAVDKLLRPFVNGGLPDCSKLAAAANMSTSELATCRAGQRRREARVEPSPLPRAPVAETAPSPLPMPAEPTIPDAKDICKMPGMENAAVCKSPLPPNTPSPPN
jgi:hypothetical protein